MTVTATTTATSTMVASVGWTLLGGVVIFLLISALATKEIAAYAGVQRLIPLHRALTVAIVPLSLAVAVVIVQQFTALA